MPESASTISVTSAAECKVVALQEEHDDPNLKLRVYIIGGGCHGFQYGFAFEEEANTDDIYAFRSSQLNVLIDPISHQYLGGATIDFVCDAQGERFIINNPRARTTCGCNNSFSI